MAAGFAFQHFFIGEGYKEFWGKALFEGQHNHILHAMHEVPDWVGWAPTLAMLAGFALSYLYYIAAPSLPAATARAFRPLYLFLLNKWYFDELYDWLFVRPAFWIGRLLWKRGDGTIIDGLGPDGIANRVLWTTGRVVKLQTGYVYHYAFAMLIGVALIVTWLHVRRRSGAMTSTGFGLLSLITFFPLVGALAIAALNKEAKGNARWIALYTTLFTLGASLYLWANFDPGQPRLPVRRGDGLARRLHQLQDGRRRHLDAVRGAHRVPDAAVHPGELGVDRGRASRST